MDSNPSNPSEPTTDAPTTPETTETQAPTTTDAPNPEVNVDTSTPSSTSDLDSTPEVPAVETEPATEPASVTPVEPATEPVAVESSPTEPVATESQATTEPTPQVVPVADPAASEVTPTPVNPGHGLGIASLVLSILGVHLVGLILGIVALNQSKKAGHKNGLALAGIIIGAIGLVFVVIGTILFFSVALTLPFSE